VTGPFFFFVFAMAGYSAHSGPREARGD
jgi:hypothetical protein